ncbi:MAG TPA: flagellar protein FlgN [Thermodesulfobacteriota bacterium]
MEIDRLIGHLNGEIRLCKELVSLLQRETEAIVSRDYRALYEIVGQKEHLVTRVNAQSEARADFIRAALAFLGAPQEEPSLAAVIEMVRGPARQDIENCRSTLQTLASSIKELNSLNARVIENSLENVRKTLGFLGNFLQPSVYKPGGKMDEFAPKGSRLNKGA